MGRVKHHREKGEPDMALARTPSESILLKEKEAKSVRTQRGRCSVPQKEALCSWEQGEGKLIRREEGSEGGAGP